MSEASISSRTLTGDELFARIQEGLGPEAHRHRGIDAAARRDTAIAGGSYRPPGVLVDGFRAGDADFEVSGVVVSERASTPVLRRAVELGANMVISRSAFLGDSQDRPVSKPEPALAEKIDFITRNKLAVLRLQDPRLGPTGRAITAAFANAVGLTKRDTSPDPAAGLVYATAATPVITWVRRCKAALDTPTVRLVGNPNMSVSGIALATETNRPNALAPLISRPEVNLLVCGEVHETETTAYVMDAIALGQKKAMLIVGAIAMERPAAKALAAWLPSITQKRVTYLPAAENLSDVA